jgi:hypothetical protein
MSKIDAPGVPETLKSCPFCGEMPTLLGNDDGSEEITGVSIFLVRCETVDCPAHRIDVMTPWEWNRRAPIPELKGKTE